VRPPALIRSGWWVLVAAVFVTALVAIAFIWTPLEPATSNGLGSISTEPSLVDPAEIIRAMARDGLEALTDPAFMTPDAVTAHNEAERGKLLVSSDPVVGVSLGGEARAYPLRLLRWHEVVNDTVGGVPVAVTYSPLSGGVAVWDRVVDGAVLEFAVSGRLIDSNTLLYDRRPKGTLSSLWRQLTGEAITGPSAGRRLTSLPVVLATWADWTSAHPETTVMAPNPDSKRLYRRDPYHSYRGSDVLRFPVDPLPPEGDLALKDLVAAIGFPDGEAYYALRYLEQATGAPQGSWAAFHDGRVYVIDFDAEAGSFSVRPEDTTSPRPRVRFGYWFAWYAVDPEIVPLP